MNNFEPRIFDPFRVERKRPKAKRRSRCKPCSLTTEIGDKPKRSAKALLPAIHADARRRKTQAPGIAREKREAIEGFSRNAGSNTPDSRLGAIPDGDFLNKLLC
jgi:hypothetical protein